MNKLLFKLRRSWDSNIVLISNNHKDLEDYLNANYDWYNVKMKEECVVIQESQGFEKVIGTVEWVKHV